jgi:hypothetical protein
MPGRSIRVRSGHYGENTRVGREGTLEFDGVVDDALLVAGHLVG